jgi:hypothetical protein
LSNTMEFVFAFASLCSSNTTNSHLFLLSDTTDLHIMFPFVRQTRRTHTYFIRQTRRIFISCFSFVRQTRQTHTCFIRQTRRICISYFSFVH